MHNIIQIILFSGISWTIMSISEPFLDGQTFAVQEILFIQK
jgi:hypothetical protein